MAHVVSGPPLCRGRAAAGRCSGQTAGWREGRIPLHAPCFSLSIGALCLHECEPTGGRDAAGRLLLNHAHGPRVVYRVPRRRVAMTSPACGGPGAHGCATLQGPRSRGVPLRATVAPARREALPLDTPCHYDRTPPRRICPDSHAQGPPRAGASERKRAACPRPARMLVQVLLVC